eukprot:1975131-Rhodomonas_salina.4
MRVLGFLGSVPWVLADDGGCQLAEAHLGVDILGHAPHPAARQPLVSSRHRNAQPGQKTPHQAPTHLHTERSPHQHTQSPPTHCCALALCVCMRVLCACAFCRRAPCKRTPTKPHSWYKLVPAQELMARFDLGQQPIRCDPARAPRAGARLRSHAAMATDLMSQLVMSQEVMPQEISQDTSQRCAGDRPRHARSRLLLARPRVRLMPEAPRLRCLWLPSLVPAPLAPPLSWSSDALASARTSAVCCYGQPARLVPPT